MNSKKKIPSFREGSCQNDVSFLDESTIDISTSVARPAVDSLHDSGHYSGTGGKSTTETDRTHHVECSRLGRSLKLFVGTWNMGNAMAVGLEYFLPRREDEYDIIAIGLQESTYSMADSEQPVGEIFTERCIEHLKLSFMSALGDGYYIVAHLRRAQLQLYIFALNSLKERISEPQKSTENTGFLHVFPNKGGQCVTFKVDGTSLAFISCHLTAHEGAKHCRQRNDSTKEILNGVRGAGDSRFDVSVQFHHTFWMGDMNYRLDLRDDDEKIKSTAVISTLLGTATATANIANMAMTRIYTAVSPTNSAELDSGRPDKTQNTQSERILPQPKSTSRKQRKSISVHGEHATAVSDKSNPSKYDRDSFLIPPLEKPQQVSFANRDEVIVHPRRNSGTRTPRRGSGTTRPRLSPRTPSMDNDDDDASSISSIDDDFDITLPTGRLERMKMVFDLIAEERWTELLLFDELTREMREGRVLGGFTALQPCFPPTFKRSRDKAIDLRSEARALKKYYFDEFEDEEELQWCLSCEGNDKFDLNRSLSAEEFKKRAQLNRAKMSLEVRDSMDDLLKLVADDSLVQRDDYSSRSYPSDNDGSSAKYSLRGSNKGDPQNEQLEDSSKFVEGVANEAGQDEPMEKNDNARSVFTKEGCFPASMLFYHRKRIPSYTDRILYRSLPGFASNLTVLTFESCEKVVSSDHKPVRASFHLLTVGGAHDIMVHKHAPKTASSPGAVGRHGSHLFELELFNLKASNLAEMDDPMFGGGSDPYIVVTSDPPNLLEGPHPIKSSTITHNLNPDWKGEKLRVKFLTADLGGLSRNAHLILSVWDKDYTNADDLIGVCTIPLKTIIEHVDRDGVHVAKDHVHDINAKMYIDFDEELLSNGNHNGRLMGRIAVKGNVEDMKASYVRSRSKVQSLTNLEDDAEPCCRWSSCNCTVA